MENNKQLKSFKDLVVWQKAVDLAMLVYSITERFPKSEFYGITNQMRRSAVSISSNIAEGFKRNHKKEKSQFYNVAYGSVAELESQIEVSRKLNFLDDQNYQSLVSLVVEIGKMLDGLIKSANKSPRSYLLNSIFFLIFLYSVFYVLNPAQARAASLYFSPSSGSYNVGQTFSAGIYVSSSDQAINAASGIISFPQDKLEIINLLKTGSIINLWVQEPSFFNSAGTANFEGIVLNPGFTGQAGKIITLVFKIKAAGTAPLTFSSGSVLANDGKGTNILSSMGSANFVLSDGVAAPSPAAPATPSGVPDAPQITSATHPDSEKWYALADAEFNWTLPKGITGARLLVDDKPGSYPAVTYTKAIDSKKVVDMDDGVWYFHARLRNSAGWGKVAHFRFQIDTKPPEPFTIKFADSKETDNPRPTALFSAADSLSGIDYYKIKISDGDFFNVSSDVVENNPYVLPYQASGKRIITVQAFDKAGNSASASEEFTVKPIAPPTIVEYSSKVTEGEAGFIKGHTYSEAEVVAWFEKRGAWVFEKSFSVETKSNRDGDFMVTVGRDFKEGDYNVWLEAVDARGARSAPTEKLTISIEPPALLKIGLTLITVLAIAVPLVALFFLLIYLIWYGRHKLQLFRKRIKKEVGEIDRTLHRAFDRLRDDVREQIRMLEKMKSRRELTEEEGKILKKLKKDLDNAEKAVKKEIEELEKEVK